MGTRHNNFDFLRLAAALAVLFSHSFPLSYGRDRGHEPLFVLIGGYVWAFPMQQVVARSAGATVEW